MQLSREPPAARLRQSLHPPWAPEQGLETRLSHMWEADGGPDASDVTWPSEHHSVRPHSQGHSCPPVTQTSAGQTQGKPRNERKKGAVRTDTALPHLWA